jgi:hypothetical protein
MTKTIRMALGTLQFLSIAAALAACAPRPADSQRDEASLAPIQAPGATRASPGVRTDGVPDGESASSVRPAPGLSNPCRDDGDSCVQGAALCRARGGTVIPLACNDPALVCCAL